MESMKQWLELESTRADTGGITREVMVTEGMREFGSERVDMLRHNSLGAQLESTQPPECVEFWELLTNFLHSTAVGVTALAARALALELLEVDLGQSFAM